MVVKNGFVRKRILIDKEFQFRYLATWFGMTLALLAGLLLASASMIFLFKIRTVNVLMMGNGLCAIVIAVLSIRYMIRFSHQIAGPAYRLERVIRQVADGTYEGYVTLRKKDYLKHVAESVNYLVDRLEDREKELRLVHRKALELANALKQEGKTSPEIDQLSHWLVKKLEEMSPTKAVVEPPTVSEVPYLAREAQPVDAGV